MRLISWNVNGIRAVTRKGTIQELVAKYSPDILCLQETKAHKDQSEIDFEGYEEYWNSAEKKGYSGTAIFTKHKPLSIILDLPESELYKFTDKFGNINKEGRVTVAEFEDFYVATVYTPNSKDKLERLGIRTEQWDKAFLEFMKELEKKKPVLFCGDLNVAHKEIDLARPAQNVGKHGFTNEEREGFQNFIDAGFVDTFRMFNDEGDNYTWWTAWGNARANNVGWRIDYWLVSKALQNKVRDAQILTDVMGSDHAPVLVEVDL